jgi:hypothetical protein
MTFSWWLHGLTRVVPAAVLVIGGLSVGAPSAAADDGQGSVPLHNVKYTIWSEQPFRNAQIYYRDIDPPNFADYSHNPFQFSPAANFDTGPNRMWTQDVQLVDPNDWAMVVVVSQQTQPVAVASVGMRSPSSLCNQFSQKASIS